MKLRLEVKQTFDWQHQWLPKMKHILGPRLLREGSFDEDTQQSTDLIVLTTQANFRIACRLRTPGYETSFGHQATITCRRENGAACEWHKMILGGMGDWFFYGHASHKDPAIGHIQPWFIFNLSAIRPWLVANHGPERGPNRDAIGRRCWFYAFDVPRLLRDLGQVALIDANPGHQMVLL